MAKDVIPISSIPPDIDPMATATISSKLKEPFRGMYDGREVIVPPMVKKQTGRKVEWIPQESRPLPLPIAVHLARHIAKRLLQQEHRRKIDVERSEKKKQVLETEAIPEFDKRVDELSKEMVNEQKEDKLDELKEVEET